jgi:NitT/TauT family transport system permease protein
VTLRYKTRDRLVTAAFPFILAGLKIGWAFAWRTLIAAEPVFGVASGRGGLGWYIFESKNQLDILEVFAGLLTIILIDLLVENVVFRTPESRTVPLGRATLKDAETGLRPGDQAAR